VPTGRSRGQVQTNQVVILVTGAAPDCVDSMSVGSTPNIHSVAMPILALARKVPAGVAIHTARVT
jgi:hypothetical protein